MPQKQPPATTAVCCVLLVAIGASTAGFGMAVIGLSPALQAIAPPSVTINRRVDAREKLLINELLLSEVVMFRARILRVASFTKVSSLPNLVAHRNFRSGCASDRQGDINRVTP